MIKKWTFLIILLQSSLQSTAEDENITQETTTIVFSGYIKSEAYYDNRQILGSIASQQLVYPLQKKPDPNGNDINSHGQGQMVPFESRVRMLLTGLKANQADIMGVIEADFEGKEDSGTADIYFNLFRMRHAYAQLDWEHLSVLLGQTWHPTTIPEVSPQCISFNSGRPIEQYTRSPQCTLSYNFYTEHPTWVTGWKTVYPTYDTQQIRLSFTATSEVDFVSDGPIGQSSQYMRFAIVPNLHLQVKGYWDGHVAGCGLDYKRLRPRLQSPQGYSVQEQINSVAALWFFGFNRPTYQINTKLTVGQNMTDRDTIGGYAVQAESINPITGAQKYTNISALTFWTDIIISRFKRAEPALFFGIAKNLGSSRPIVLNQTDPTQQRTVFGLGTDVALVVRVSPRLRMKIKSIVCAVEYEYTRASFGTLTTSGDIVNKKPVSNNRVLFAAFYYF